MNEVECWYHYFWDRQACNNYAAYLFWAHIGSILTKYGFQAGCYPPSSNVIASVVPIKLTDVKTSLTDIAPIIETFLPRLFGFGPWALEPFRDRAYSGSQKSEVCPMPYALCPMPYALCPMPSRTSSFWERLYNLTIAKFTPHSSMNIKSLKQTSRIFCQNSYRRFWTLSVPLSEGKRVFF